MTISEMLEMERKKEVCHALTRAQAQKLTETNNNKTKHTIEEQRGTVLNKRNYDIIFHLIPRENDDLKSKIMNKFAAATFPNTWKKLSKNHYSIAISNQFSNKHNMGSTLDCIENILKICTEELAENIAINIDYDSIRHYIHFKKTFEEIFASTQISTTFFLNKIITLSEREDIDQILDLYHKSLLGVHLGIDRMQRTISKFYKWDNMSEDIKNYIKKSAKKPRSLQIQKSQCKYQAWEKFCLITPT